MQEEADRNREHDQHDELGREDEFTRRVLPHQKVAQRLDRVRELGVRFERLRPAHERSEVSCRPAIDEHAAQRDEERLELEPRDEQAVDRADDRAAEEHDGHGEERMHALLKQHAQEDGGTADHGTDRKVDASRDDDECRPERDDAVAALFVGDIDEVALDAFLGLRGGFATRRVIDVRADEPAVKRDEQPEHAENSHHGVAPPVASRITASSFNRSWLSSPATRPSCITTTRSDMPSSSSMSLVIIQTATPRPASSSMRA